MHGCGQIRETRQLFRANATLSEVIQLINFYLTHNLLQILVTQMES